MAAIWAAEGGLRPAVGSAAGVSVMSRMYAYGISWSKQEGACATRARLDRYI